MFSDLLFAQVFINERRNLMKKSYTGLTVVLSALILAACGVTPTSSTPTSSEVALTSITITGADDITLDFEAPFNLRTGVTATGNNGISYTSQIALTSLSSAVNTTTGALDTTKTGPLTVQYRVTVGAVVATKIRNITVRQPVATGLLVNPDFSQGTAGWDQRSPIPVVYEADGGTIALSTENGELKAIVVSGDNFFTPRFGQMNIPFEQGKIYEVSFDARSSVTKEIALQVGEVVNGDPYFNEFLPDANKILYQTIAAGSTMTRYTYQFKMNTTNVKGGILFGLGEINDQDINATLYFDNIEIKAVTVDTFAPFIKGATNINVNVGQVFNPLTGVTAIDMVEGNITLTSADVEIKNSQNQVVSAVDTSAPGVFTIKYTAKDSVNNTTTATRTINVVGMNFLNENLLTNGSFATAIGEEWSFWTRDWAPAVPVVNRSQDVALGTYSLDIAGGGEASWNIQMNHAGSQLVQGQTYRLSFTGFASVARSFSAAFENPEPNNVNYGRKNGFAFGTASSTVDFVFTVTQPTEIVRLTIELGAQEGFADGIVTFEDVRLQRLDAEPLVSNSDFSLSGWRGYSEPGVATTTSGIVNGEFKMTISQYAPYPQSWDQGATATSSHLQIVQDAQSLEGILGVEEFLNLEVGKTYTLSFDAYASEVVSITPNVFGQDLWVNHTQSPETLVGTTKTTFTKTVSTIGATLNDTEKLAFEFGKGVPSIAVDGTAVSVYLDNVSLKEVNVDVPSLYNGNMETVLGGHAIDGPATLVNTSEGALMTVNSMGAPHVPHYFYTFASLEKGDYRVKFVIKGDVARTIRFNVILPDESYRSILPEGFKDFNIVDDETYVFTTSFTVATPLTNVKVEVDFGDLGANSTSVVGSFLITELLVYRDYNS
jgi:hypothetical protein